MENRADGVPIECTFRMHSNEYRVCVCIFYTSCFNNILFHIWFSMMLVVLNVIGFSFIMRKTLAGFHACVYAQRLV